MHKKRIFPPQILFLFVICILVSCSNNHLKPIPDPIPKQVLSATYFTETSPSEIQETQTQETIFPTASLVITPTPTLHPVSIEAMRQVDIPGSPLVIEQVLPPGVNYSREIVSYLSEDLKIYALMTIPNGEPPLTGWPVIIFNHGFIHPSQYKTTERYVNYVDKLARAGYIVFRSDYRGHDKSEGVARGAYGYPDYVIDVLNGLASIKSYPLADPNRIGMWGHSMGGFITLKAMVIRQDIKVGVIWAGVVGSYPAILTDWPQVIPPLYELDPSWRAQFVESYGSPEENPEFWNSISATSYLQDISGPLQLHHSMSDDIVPFEFSNKLFHELIRIGKTSELFVYRDDNHNIALNFNLAMERTIAFFDLYLK